MNTAALDPLALRVLRALYELAELDCPADAGVLGRAVGLRAIEVARVLLVLDAHGLVSAEGARLTLAGLAQAVRSPPLSLERKPGSGRLTVGRRFERTPASESRVLPITSSARSKTFAKWGGLL